MRVPVTAICDACVLYPAPLRDLLIRLAQADPVRAHWTQQIHDEWMRNVLRDNPAIAPQRLERTRALMDAAVRDCLVAGYEGLIETVTLPDPDDRHVLAAASQLGLSYPHVEGRAIPEDRDGPRQRNLFRHRGFHLFVSWTTLPL